MQHSDLHRRKRAKNLTVAGILVGLIILFFVLTLVKLGGNMSNSVM